MQHSAPQHRQYLSFDGVGSGTPAQRQKQYSKHRASVAFQNVHEHRIGKLSQQNCEEQSLIAKDKKEAKKIKTRYIVHLPIFQEVLVKLYNLIFVVFRYGIERLVEDLIQESMAKGEFDNLSGKGKPLASSNYNPYVDFVTHKMNQIMIDNGFVPEWITLQRDIMETTDLITKILRTERKKLGPVPLSISEDNVWESVSEKVEEKVKTLNRTIDKFNLVVPIMDKQMLHFSLEKEKAQVLEKGEYKVNESKQGQSEIKQTDPLLALFNMFFNR